MLGHKRFGLMTSRNPLELSYASAWELNVQVKVYETQRILPAYTAVIDLLTVTEFSLSLWHGVKENTYFQRLKKLR